MIKIRVAILDDEEKDLIRVQEYFKSISDNELTYECDYFYEVNENFYQQYDLYVVDIELGNSNGLDISKEIKEKCPNSVLIINSKRNDLVFESFKFGIFFFIRKDHFETDMSFAQIRLTEYFKSTKQVYLCKQKHSSYKIPYEKIKYIEKVGSNIEIHLNDHRTFIENKSIKQISSEIQNSYFIQCHQSYIVNLDYVKKIEDNDFILENEKVQISRRYFKKSKEAFIHYLNTKV